MYQSKNQGLSKRASQKSILGDLGEGRAVTRETQGKGAPVSPGGRESGVSGGKLFYIGWINNKVLPYSTGNDI